MKKLIVGVAGGLLMAGCSTVAISGKGSLAGVDVKGAAGRADRTICVSNEGCWLFNSIPLFAASMDWSEKKNGIDGWSVSLFKDETGLQRVSDAFFRYADREGCDVADVVVDNRSTYPLGLFGIPDFIGNIVSVREVAVTGVLKERK